MPRVTIEYDLSDPDESRLCDENTARLRRIYPNLRVTRVEGMRATIRIEQVRQTFVAVDFSGPGRTSENPEGEMGLDVIRTEAAPTYIGLDPGFGQESTVEVTRDPVSGSLTFREVAQSLQRMGISITPPERAPEPIKPTPPALATWKDWRAAFMASRPKNRFDLMEDEDDD